MSLSVLLEVLRVCVFEILLIFVKKYNFLHFVSEKLLTFVVGLKARYEY